MAVAASSRSMRMWGLGCERLGAGSSMDRRSAPFVASKVGLGVAPAINRQEKVALEIATFLYDVRRADGIYGIELALGNGAPRFMPITVESGALLGETGTFGTGWEPRVIYTGFAPVLLLEWRHQSGAQGFWYFDAEMVRVGGADKQPPPLVSSILRQTAGAILMDLWNGLLCAPSPASLDPRARAFCRLASSTKFPMIAQCGAALPLDMSIVNLEPIRGKDRNFRVFNGSRMIEVRSSNLLKILDEQTSILERALTDLPQGQLTWPSPVDGRPLTTDAVLSLDDFQFAYRLVDDVHDLVFYAIASGADSRVHELLFPAARQTYCGKEGHRFRSRAFVPKIGDMILRHLCEYGEALESFLRAPRRTLTCFIRGLHHGHLLFNDLAGVDELVHGLEPEYLPDVVIRGPSQGGGDVEVFGKLDELFPELAGKVDRRSPDWSVLLRRAYNEQRSLIRATLEYVPRRLAAQVIAVNVDGPGTRSCAATA